MKSASAITIIVKNYASGVLLHVDLVFEFLSLSSAGPVQWRCGVVESALAPSQVNLQRRVAWCSRSSASQLHLSDFVLPPSQPPPPLRLMSTLVRRAALLGYKWHSL